MHLEEASRMGDRLIVSLTEDAHVNKGPARPFNSWGDRAHLLMALSCVDEVVPTDNAVDAILLVKPQIFVKGIDYLGGGRFTEDVQRACDAVGARLVYTTSPKKSASEIINKMKEHP